MYGLAQTVAPAAEPITTVQAKAWLRVSSSSDDTLIDELIADAREYVERVSGRQLVTATWRMTLDTFPRPGGWQFLEVPGLFPDPHSIRLPKAPLQSVSSVAYYDFSDVLNTLATTRYDVDAAHDPGRIFLAMGQTWPVVRLKPGAVRITFVAGYGAAASVPEEVKLAIKFAVAFWYENRGETPVELPPASLALLDLIWNGELEYGL